MVEETKVTHDNNGRFYRIKMDLAKEGSEIWDLTPYFKGRVGDNRFGLQVVWTYQGRLLDTTGMKPYIEGNVGNYSFDDKKDLQLATDAATVRYTGDPSDCQSGGRATYYFPEQMFPRDGIFKGYIGLLDDRDDSSQPHISGVTVWFRVLPGIAQMGHACDVYISDLDKALQNFQVKLDQHDQDYQTKLQQVIDDARNAYESETKNAHDSLDALKSQIQANRDEQENLAQHLAGTEQQIETHDVVTRPEFLDLGNRLNQQVANLRQNKTLYFQNLTELQAQYPNGTDNLCVTLDDKHLHVYDYANNVWTDAGATDVITADPATKDAIYQDSSNLAPDPDFKIVDGEWFFGADNGTPNYAFTDSQVDKSKIVEIHGYYSDATQNNWNNTWMVSKNINIVGDSVITIGMLINNKPANQPSDAHSELQVKFYDKDQVQIGQWNYNLPNHTDDDLHQFQYGPLWVNLMPTGTVYINFSVMVHGSGTLKMARPLVNSSDHLFAYDFKDVDAMFTGLNTNLNTNVYFPSSRFDPNNLVPNPTFLNLSLWNVGADNDKVSYKILDKSLNNSQIIRLTGHNASGTGDNGNEWLTSSSFSVKGQSKISSSWLLNYKPDSNADNPYVQMCIDFFDSTGNKINTFRNGFGWPTLSNNLIRYYLENVDVPSNAVTAQTYILIHSAGTVDVAYPKANYGESAIKDEDVPFLDKTVGGASINQWFLGKDLGGQVSYRVNGNEITINGFHSDVTKDNWNNTWLRFNGYPIAKDAKYLSLDLTLDAKLTQGTDDNYLEIDLIVFGDETQNNQLMSYQKQIGINDLTSGLHHEFLDGIALPDGANNFSAAVLIHNQGSVTVTDLNYQFNHLYQNTNNLPKIFICTNDVPDDWKTAKFSYFDEGKELTGYVQLAIQGDSSRSYPKKNFKTKFFSDSECKKKLKFKPKSNWQANNKFNFKANWIDATQARNLVNAQMIEKATAITPMEKFDQTSSLLTTQGLGQMEGFPVEVYLADGYYGLFTLNTKKDDKAFGMDSDNPQHEVISVELADQVFRDPKATIDEKNYLTEIHDAPSANVKSNFERLVQFINQSTPDDFVKHLGDYIDVKSCINTMLYGILSKEYDYYSKSYLLCTWNDGAYFYMVPYDLDSTWGLYWNGSKIVEDGNDPWFDFESLIKDPNQNSWISNHGQNRLFERIYEQFKPEIKKQYDLLRSTVWKNSDIIQAFKHFIDEIPETAFEHEQQKWTTLPSVKITDFAQIQNFIIKRGNAMDDFMNNHFLTQTDNGNTQPTTPQTGGTTTETPQAGSTTPTGTAPKQ